MDFFSALQCLTGQHLRRFCRAALVACTLAFIVSNLLVANLACAAEETLRIGSKRFTESYVLAQVLAQSARSEGPVEVKQGLGNTAIVYAALRAGSIDMYPEYAGTIALEILKSSKPLSPAEMQSQLAPLGLGIAIPFGFNDGYALAMRKADAERLGIETLSQFARHREMRFGLSNEFMGRADGWPGLAARYGFAVAPIGLDHGLAYEAIAKRQIDVMDIYTTDARIGQLGLRVLRDDLGYFPRYDALVIYRLDVPARFPRAWQKLLALSGTIDEASMTAMNARAELDGVAFDVIAGDYLAVRSVAANSAAEASGKPHAKESTRRGFQEKLLGPDFWRLTWQHLMLVAVAVSVAIIVSVPLAILVFPHVHLRAAVLAITGLLQTVPSLALLAVLITMMGRIGSLPALVALILYALLPIMRNTCVGLAEVPAGLRQAAQALGLSAAAQLRNIDLPLALPTIVAGVRTATAISIGTATIAAFIGAGGYGERIVTGLALNDHELLLAGALPAAMLALASELLFELLESAIKRGRRG